jgi:hypothetical protein
VYNISGCVRVASSEAFLRIPPFFKKFLKSREGVGFAGAEGERLYPGCLSSGQVPTSLPALLKEVMKSFEHISKNEEVLELAKELYLTPDEQGGHKYSLRAICTEIAQKLHKNIAPNTVLNWAKKYGWDKLWEQAAKEGITRAVKIDENKTLEEQYKEAIAKRKEQDFLIATGLKELGFQFVKEHGFSSTIEALKAIEVGLKYTQELDIDNKEQVVKIEFVGRDENTD